MRLALLLIAALGCAACDGNGKRDARQVLAAVMELRDSTPETRQERLAALDELSSDVPEAERARRTCGGAYRALANAHALTDAPRPAASATQVLAAATEEVTRARDLIGECNAATRELRQWLERR